MYLPVVEHNQKKNLEMRLRILKFHPNLKDEGRLVVQRNDGRVEETLNKRGEEGVNLRYQRLSMKMVVPGSARLLLSVDDRNESV